MLNQSNILSGVKPIKRNLDLQNRNDEIKFDKGQPLSSLNYPQFSFARYTFHGYKKDAAGLKHPIQWEETMPAGRRITLKKSDYPGITVTKVVPIALSGPLLKY